MEKGEHSWVIRKQKEKEFIGVAYQGQGYCDEIHYRV
jgi:hypothetical protein